MSTKSDDAVRGKPWTAPGERAKDSAGGQTKAETPAAGAHAVPHLVNADATPGAGTLPSTSRGSGKDVDGGAG